MRIELKQGKEIYLPNGNTIYIGDCIGKGGSSLVYEVFEDKQLNIIRGRLKEYYPFENAPERIENGELIFHNNSHDLEKELFQLQKDFIDEFDKDDKTRNYFPQLVELFKANNTFYLFTSYSVDETLPQYLKHNSSITTIVAITLKICKFVKILHEHGYLHLDIKDSNFGVEEQDDDFYLRIFDFGSFSEMSIDGSLSDSTQLLSYSKAFSAPEIFSPQKITKKTDYYSLGVLLIHLLTEGEKNALKNDDELLNDVIPSIKQKFINSGEFTDQEYYLFEYIEQFIKSTVKYKPDDRCDDIDELIGFLDNFIKKNPFTVNNIKLRAEKAIETNKNFKYKNDSNLIPENTGINNIFTNHSSGDVVRCVYLYGEGGLGKSACAKRLFHEFTDKKTDNISIYVSLNGFNTNNTIDMPYQAIIKELINSDSINNQNVEFLKNFIDNECENTLIIFDGLNEMDLDKETNKIFYDQLEDFAQNSMCRIVVTDRVDNSAYSKIFVGFEFPSLTDEQVLKMISLKFSNIKKIIGNNSLFGILHVPFYLDVFCKPNEYDDLTIKTKFELLDNYYYPKDKAFPYKVDEKYKGINEWLYTAFLPYFAYLLSVENILVFDKQYFYQIYESMRYEMDRNELAKDNKTSSKPELCLNYLKKYRILIETDGDYFFSQQLLQEFFASKLLQSDAFIDYNISIVDEFINHHYHYGYFSRQCVEGMLEFYFESISNISNDSFDDCIGNEKLLNVILKFCEKSADFDALFSISTRIINGYLMQCIMLNYILDKSLRNQGDVFNPYGQLFYYVPTFNLYKPLVNCLISNKKTARDALTYSKLSIIRDVCFSYGLYNNISEICENSSSEDLFDRIEERNDNRYFLNKLFFEQVDDKQMKFFVENSQNVYPRIFNVREAVLRITDNTGIINDPPKIQFKDDLGLFQSSNAKSNSELIGLVTFDDLITNSLNKHKSKVTGVIINSPNINIDDLSYLYKNNIKVLILPEKTSKPFSEELFFNNCSFMNLVYIPSMSMNEFECRIYYYRSHWFKKFDEIKISSFDQFYIYHREITSVEILECISTLPDSAFENCTLLKKVILNENISEIGNNTFANCENLQDVYYRDKNGELHNGFPKSLKTIGENAFKNTAVSELCFNHKINFGSRVFSDCKKLKKVAFVESFESIPSYMFSNCTELMVAEICDSIKIISDHCFHNTSITQIELPNQMYKLGCGAFEKSKLKSISLDVENISAACFSHCEDLEIINISSRIKTIGSNAFEYTGLTSFSIPNKKFTISTAMFSNCMNLKTIINCENINIIGAFAFFNCKLLKCVDLSNATVIGESAFESSGLYEVTINNQANLGKCCFSECNNLKIDLIHYDYYNICRNRCFGRHKENMNNSSIDNSVKSVELFISFDDELYVTSFNDEITHIIFGENVTTIHSDALKSFPNISKITIKSKKLSLGANTFSNLYNLKEVYFDDAVNISEIPESSFQNCTSLETLKLPNSLKVIGNSCFNNCKQLYKFITLENIEIIGDNAFEKCESLEFIHLQEPLKAIGDYAFRGCSNLNEINIPHSVKSIGTGCFLECKNLKKANLQADVKTIKNNTFAFCDELIKVILNRNINSICDYAFYGCSNLNELVNCNFSSIGVMSFARCSSLVEIVTQKINVISNNAFENCKNLKCIKTDPNDEKSQGVILDYLYNEGVYIGENAFLNCKSIEFVYLPKHRCIIKDKAFYGCSNLKKVFINEEYIDNFNSIQTIFGNTIDKSIFFKAH